MKRPLLLGLITAIFMSASTWACQYDFEDLDKLFSLESIINFGLEREEVVLTIDDGPSAATAKILELLKERQIQATFFVTGNQARKHPKIMEQMAADGHIIANHTSSHLFDYSGAQALANDIVDTYNVSLPYINKSQGRRLYFRSPGGVWNNWRHGILNNHSVIKRYIGPIYWNVGGQMKFDAEGRVKHAADWDCWKRGIAPKTCANGYYNELLAKGSKGVILMHDLKEQSFLMLKDLLDRMEQDGTDGNGNGRFVFKSMDDLHALDQFELP